MSKEALLQKYLSEHKIDSLVYEDASKLPRFVRWNSYFPVVSDEELEADLGEFTRLKGPYYSDVLMLPGSAKLSGTKLWKTGRASSQIMGVDISSVVCVKALQLAADDHFLDLCCAPGVKLCIAADIIGNSGSGSVTGTDISKHRLSTCVSLIKKHKVGKARVFLGDAQVFNQLAPCALELHSFKSVPRPPKRIKLTSESDAIPDGLFYSTSVFRRKANYLVCNRKYSKILVDVECSHEGSIKHVIKSLDNIDNGRSEDSFISRISSEKELQDLYELQRNILSRGLCLLDAGGILVYSTCSLSQKQNEDIVMEVLAKEDFNDRFHTCQIEDEILPSEFKALRVNDFVYYHPRISGTSGMFIAKIRRSDSDQ